MITRNYKELRNYIDNKIEINDVVLLQAHRYIGDDKPYTTECGEMALKKIKEGYRRHQEYVWSKETIEELKSKTGIVVLHPYKKRIIWCKTMYDATAYINEINGIDHDDISNPKYANCADAWAAATALDEKCVYQGWLWFRAFDLTLEKLQKRAYYIIPPFVNITKGKEFNTIDDAVAWLVANGYTKSAARAASSLKRHLRGETSSCYKMKWRYI